MPIPTYDQFIEPILRYLAQHPDGVLARDAHEAAAEMLGLTPEDRAQVIPSGQITYRNRAGWAHDRLKRVTPEGVAFAARHPQAFPREVIEVLATAGRRHNTDGDEEEIVAITVAPDTTASPDDRLNSAIREIRQSVEANLLEMLLQVSPEYFESVVLLDLLHRMGYGARREDLQRVGGVGDGGIDGVISLDKLGFDKVYVQAKRWQGSVGRPDVQAFYGALAGQRATRGVFITTSNYTAQARDFAKSVERVVLVDGARLAELMVDHEVGVTVRQVKVPQLDTDYFEN